MWPLVAAENRSKLNRGGEGIERRCQLQHRSSNSGERVRHGASDEPSSECSKQSIQTAATTLMRSHGESGVAAAAEAGAAAYSEQRTAAELIASLPVPSLLLSSLWAASGGCKQSASRNAASTAMHWEVGVDAQGIAAAEHSLSSLSLSLSSLFFSLSVRLSCASATAFVPNQAHSARANTRAAWVQSPRKHRE